MGTNPTPSGENVATADGRIVMHDVPWEHYEAMLALRGEKSVPRMVYLDGALDDAAVEACVADRFRRMRFPQPKGGGAVTVNYPLLFSPTAAK